ncbi:hypothetical protein PLESTB_001559000 [Pleodorina starrii]|uniref:non-specific serine/threonine protein kinase n=1 Tax=Pleodorina starrii TaxID=330485 RepID=A0A9W6F839_9CHLO|nr:hypothetical protein PLESTB_001559000 [Pleodorina starrii]GLC72805.1 hypothetical protein PLESTF_001295000 [Pleodorina starrii]
MALLHGRSHHATGWRLARDGNAPCPFVNWSSARTAFSRKGRCQAPRLAPRAGATPEGSAGPQPSAPAATNPWTSGGDVPPPEAQLPGGAAVPLEPGRMVGDGKYVIEEVLGAGSNAVAYRARRTSDGSEVALKALSLRSLRDWKQLELFQREGRILASLDHPAVPRYVDYFEEDDPRDRAFVLVQEIVRGKSLASMIQGGQRATEQELTRIAGELLAVLDYLGSLRPPVIHRDVKPDNIILEGGTWGGRVFLVDFGGVQAVASARELSGLGSTIVGTYGYMAPEQFRGAAEPASDLYALGATLLYLLTGQPPSAFPQERMRINWRAGLGPSASASLVSSPQLASLLDGLLEPVAEDRLTAAEARQVLQGRDPPERLSGSGSGSSRSTSGFAKRRASQRGGGPQMPPPPPATLQEAYLQQALATSSRPPVPVSRPAGTRVQLEVSADGSRLDVVIPPRGFTMDTAFTGTFAIAWNAFVAVWTVGALASGGLLFALFSAPFWLAGAQLAKGALGGALTRERLAVGRKRWRLGQQLAVLGSDGKADFLDGKNERLQEGQTRDLTAARTVTTAFINGVPQTAIELIEGVSKYRFGEGLELVEQQWIVQEVNAHIAAVKGAELDFSTLPPPEMPKVLDDDSSDDD